MDVAAIRFVLSSSSGSRHRKSKTWRRRRNRKAHQFLIMPAARKTQHCSQRHQRAQREPNVTPLHNYYSWRQVWPARSSDKGKMKSSGRILKKQETQAWGSGSICETVNHKGHEGTRRKRLGPISLRDTSGPWWSRVLRVASRNRSTTKRKHLRLLRTLHDLQRLRFLQPLAQDGFPGGDFSNGIGMDHIGAVRQRVAKGNLNADRAGFQRKMLVADGRGSSVLGDGHDDHCQIEAVLGTIGDLDDPVNSVVADLGRLKPFEQQRRGHHRLKLLVNGVRGMAGVLDLQGESGNPGTGRASGQQSFWSECDSFRQIATGYAPDGGGYAAAGMKQHVEFHACVERGQLFVHDGERGSLRGQQPAETNCDCNQANDLGEIHTGSFDFTLGTA